jgi:hypothetical protein
VSILYLILIFHLGAFGATNFGYLSMVLSLELNVVLEMGMNACNGFVGVKL